MRRTPAAAGLLGSLTVAVALFTAVTPPAQAAPLVQLTAVDGEVVAGEYIVTTKGSSVAAAHRAGIAVRHEYRHAITGFAAKLTDEQVRALRRDRDVVAIEPNQVVRALTTQSPAPWNLDRIDQRSNLLDNAFVYFADGSGVTAYVIDTGIDPVHPEFGGRAAVAFDALGGNGIDCQGHGTHVAGTVGSTTYGVAKRVQLRGVRVLNCQGSGSYAGVIAGIDWVTANSPGPAVANLSLGGAYSPAMNQAVDSLSRSGVFVAAAVGSSMSDSCRVSPVSAAGAFGVAATDARDNGAPFNDYGSCVDICAPGINITSTVPGGGVATYSGTSMATPHVTGVAAMYKTRFGDHASSTIARWLIAVATPISPQRCTPGRLLYTDRI